MAGRARTSRRASESTALALREVAAAPAWPALLESLARAPDFWVLESALVTPRLGRFSFAGVDPYARVMLRRGRVRVEPFRVVRPATAKRRSWAGDPLDALRFVLPPPPLAVPSDAPPFVGGAVGVVGYELAARLDLAAARALAPLRRRPGLGTPELAWLLVDRVLAFDHARGRLVACALGFGSSAERARARAERAVDALAEDVAPGRARPFRAPPARRKPPGPLRVRAAELHSASQRVPAAGRAPLRFRDAKTGLTLGAFFDADRYVRAVERIRAEIAAGRVYQANLTHRLDAPCRADPWRIYSVLRRDNPAPFAAYLALPGVAVVGSSPERFLRLDPDGRVESRPIKGTRPRGATPAEDAALRRALESSAKERAENVMIADLVRNDLGRVCEPGSVAVPELRVIEEYATVFQMVSTVTGRLRRGADVFDLLRASFPPGSMTGAPKIAALHLLAELEPVRRGLYAGVLGSLDVRGGADLAVVIRTLFLRPGIAHLHVGGGIVADSDPAAEWQESLDKARALLDAVAGAA